MKVVSSQSESDVQRHVKMQIVKMRLRELAANIIRVVRGAGNSEEIERQAEAYVNALNEYCDAVGHFPHAHDIAQALDVNFRQGVKFEDGEERNDEADARRDIIRGSLRIVAAELLDQTVQIRAAERDYSEGLRSWETLRAEQRKRWAAAKERRQAEEQADKSNRKRRTKKPN